MISTDELDHVLHNILPSYQGTYALDQLPQNRLMRPSSLICNTDVASLPGTHWMALCLPPQHHLIYFIEPYDLALHKLLPPLYEWMKQYPSQIITLPYTLQPLESRLCGAYCAFILTHLPKFHYNLNALVYQHFSSYDLNANDKKVACWWEYINKHTTSQFHFSR